MTSAHYAKGSSTKTGERNHTRTRSKHKHLEKGVCFQYPFDIKTVAGFERLFSVVV